METTFGFYDLIEMFPKPGCAVCNRILLDTQHLLDSILYEYTTDADIQADFRDSRGLCDEHGHQFVQVGNALGIAVLYEHPLNAVLHILSRSAPEANPQQRLMSRLFPQTPNAAIVSALEATKPCIACKVQAEGEARYVAIISEFIADERMASAYRTSEGLCLNHFKQVLRHTHDTARSRLLIEMQTAIWTRLRDELREFMRKYNYKHAHEAIGAEEGTSWRRVVTRLGGERGVFGVRRTTS